MDADFRVRQSRPEEDRLLARHFYRMWRDNGVAEEQLAGDWERRVLDFVEAARVAYRYCAFVAEQDGAGILGSAGCQVFGGLYPDILAPALRRYGYLWGVYVEPDHRRRGIAHAHAGGHRPPDVHRLYACATARVAAGAPRLRRTRLRTDQRDAAPARPVIAGRVRVGATLLQRCQKLRCEHACGVRSLT